MPIAKDAPIAHGILLEIPLRVREPERHRWITWGEFIAENAGLGHDRLELIATALFNDQPFRDFKGSDFPCVVEVDIEGNKPLVELNRAEFGKIVDLLQWWGDAHAAAGAALRQLGEVMRAEEARPAPAAAKPMRADGWDLAGAIEHHPEVDKVRTMIAAVRASMPEDKRDFEGLVVRELHTRHAAEIGGSPAMVQALLAWALLHLVEDAEYQEMIAAEGD